MIAEAVSKSKASEESVSDEVPDIEPKQPEIEDLLVEKEVVDEELESTDNKSPEELDLEKRIKELEAKERKIKKEIEEI